MSVLCFGEIVWDDIGHEESRESVKNIGGAPLNVAVHCHRLGMKAGVISAIGCDDLGKQALSVVRRLGVDICHVAVVEQQTCLIQVAFSAGNEPYYQISDNVSWDYINVTSEQVREIQREGWDCLYFGTLHQRSQVSKDSIHRLVKEGGFREVFLDVNLREPFYNRETLHWSLTHCDTAKMNLEEAHIIGKLFGMPTENDSRLATRLRKSFGIQKLIVTCGKDGARYYTDGCDGAVQSPVIQVADTVGAGDAFSAGLMTRLQNGDSLQAACKFANHIGALIASKQGSIPDYSPDELLV